METESSSGRVLFLSGTPALAHGLPKQKFQVTVQAAQLLAGPFAEFGHQVRRQAQQEWLAACAGARVVSRARLVRRIGLR